MKDLLMTSCHSKLLQLKKVYQENRLMEKTRFFKFWIRRVLKLASSYKYICYFESIGSALLYGTCSTSMAFLNKAIISSYDFDFPLFIMASQMSVCIILLEIFRMSGCVPMSKYTLKSGKTFIWPSLFYALHSFTALHALGGMSIPMYAAVKRCSPIVTLFLSVILLHKKCPSLKLILSVILITSGCILASFGDLNLDIKAYKYGTVSVFAQALYLTLAQRSLQSMTALDVLYLSSYNTILIFASLSLFFEYQEIILVNRFSDPSFLFCFMLQNIVGVVLNYSLFLCTEKNSALTTSLIGVLKSVFQTVIGIFTFGGIKFNILNGFGLSLNLFGGVLYTYVKYKENVKHNSIDSSSRNNVCV